MHMRIIVADTGPLHYLLLIDHIEILPSLLGSIVIPDTVRNELTHEAAPPSIRAWAAAPPPWLSVVTQVPIRPLPGKRLDPGEEAAIALALNLKADLILIDDKAGRSVAASQNLPMLGTLGVLDRAAERRLIDIGTAVNRLKATNFRASENLLDQIVVRHAKGSEA